MNRREFLIGAGALGITHFTPRPALASLHEGMWFERSQPLMGSYVNVAVFGQDRARNSSVIDGCFEHIVGQIAIISNWDQGSETCRLGRERALEISKTSPQLVEILKVASQVYELTNGVFHPLMERLNTLWRIARDAGAIPDPVDLKYAQRDVERSFLSFNRSTVSIQGRELLDLGAFGQGYIADCGVEFLRNAGVVFAKVDCSGDMRFLGETSWEIDIEHPRNEGEMLGTIVVRGGKGVATSGDYRSCWFVNGRRYHHLIDPRSGRPTAETQSVTVIASSGVVADALATAISFFPPKIGLNLMRRIAGVSGVIVGADGKPSSFLRDF